MVSCLFCRKKVWHQKRLSNTFRQNTFTTYYCSRCRIFLKVVKTRIPELPEKARKKLETIIPESPLLEITVEAYRRGSRKKPQFSQN